MPNNNINGKGNGEEKNAVVVISVLNCRSRRSEIWINLRTGKRSQ